MATESVPTAEVRPKRSAINALAATWLTRELVERVPEYAAYAATEGMDALTGQISEAMKPFRLGRREEAEFARRIEEATMIGAPGRTEVVLAGFDKMHIDAAVMLEGGWIRQISLAAPFEGPYSHVSISRADGSVGQGYAFRHPDLDERGLLMVVPDRDRGCENIPGDLLPWEKIAGATPVNDLHLAGVVARHHQLDRGAARMSEQLASKERDGERSFAEAEFRELAPVERTKVLASLADELARSLADGDGPMLRSVLDRLAGVTSAAGAISDISEVLSHAPEEPRMDGPRG